MNAKYRVLWVSLFVIALFAGLSVTQAQTTVKTDAVTAISNLENDGVKADLAGDPAFYQKVLAEECSILERHLLLTRSSVHWSNGWRAIHCV